LASAIAVTATIATHPKVTIVAVRPMTFSDDTIPAGYPPMPA
jgi:hypothetical protein